MFDMERDGVTQGLLGDFVACRQRAWYSVEKLSPSEYGWSKSLEFGNLFHMMMENRHRCLMARGKTYKGRSVENEWYRPLAQKHIEAQDEIKMWWRIADVMFPQYCEKFKKDAKLKWLGAESEFKVGVEPDGKFPATLRGKRDGLVQIGKEIWIYELKTKSRIDDELRDAINFDFQSLFYAYATLVELERASGKVKPRIGGVIYDVVRTPGLKLGAKEDVSDFVERIREDVASRPDHYFIRHEIPFTEHQLIMFGRELTDKLVDLHNWLRNVLQTYQNQQACIGKYSCRYLAACSAGCDTRLLIERDRMYPELSA